MKISLKAQNLPFLAVVLGFNIFVAYALVSPNPADFPQVVSNWTAATEQGLPVIVTILALTLNSILSSDTKARLIYWRWSLPYPATKAFSVLGPNDARVDMNRLAADYAPLPTDPRLQNGLWYRLLRRHSDEASVVRAHKESLFFRDYAVMSIWFLALGPYVGVMRSFDSTALIYVAILIGQFMLTLVAARQTGRRLVTNVLAIASNPT